jgi:hypothetical protein
MCFTESLFLLYLQTETTFAGVKKYGPKRRMAAQDTATAGQLISTCLITLCRFLHDAYRAESKEGSSSHFLKIQS